MTIYRLVPSAKPDDPSWGRAINQGVVLVRANSTGEARAIAALEEAAIAGAGIPLSTTQVVASAFRDEKLYTVIVDANSEYPDTGPVRVLAGRLLHGIRVNHKD